MADADLPSKVVGTIGPADRLAGKSPVRLFKSTELFGEATEVRIDHSGIVYRLRITRQGKLILTK